MGHEVTITIALAITAGVLVQWIAQRLRIPAILPLILAGAFLGETYAHVIRPETLGNALGPIVAMSIALILFEGGLTLNISDMKHAPVAVWRMLSFGVIITAALIAFAARLILHLPWAQSVLVGTILVVTGPTVVGPILRRVQLKPAVRSVLQWEGILIDPIGAIAAICVWEFVLYAYGQNDPNALWLFGGYYVRLAVGVATGIVGGYLISRVLCNPRLAPSREEDLNNLLGLGGAMAIYGLSERISPESGVAAVTVAGVVLGNLKAPGLREMRHFKGQISMLLIGTLFILLAAQMDLRLLVHSRPNLWWFIGLTILAARPLSVLVSTRGTRLQWKDRVFTGLMGPKGIVAASVATLFALEMSRLGIPGSQGLLDAVYGTILASVIFAAVMVWPLGWLLGTLAPAKTGVLIVGANTFGRKLASILDSQQVPVTLVDTNPRNCSIAMQEGITAHCENAADMSLLDKVDFSDIGTVVAMTTNDEVNTLVCEWAKETVGPRRCFQVRNQHTESPASSEHTLGGLPAFSPGVPLHDVTHLLERGQASVMTLEDREYDPAPGEALRWGIEPAKYLLGTIANKRFEVYSPEAGTCPSGDHVILEVHTPTDLRA